MRSVDSIRAVVGLGIFLTFGAILQSNPPITIVGVVLALGIVAGAASPLTALSAILVATPFIFQPVVVHGDSFSLLELAIAAGGTGIALRAGFDAIRLGSWSRLYRVLQPWPVTIGAIGVLAAATISLVTLADPNHRTESLREYRLVIVEPLLVLGACRWVFADVVARRFCAGVLVLTGAAIGAVAIGQVVVGGDGVVADGVRRATGPYPHPNNLALFLERAGLLGVGIAIGGHGIRRWVGLAGAAALLGVGATFSRGAVVAVVAGLLVVLIGQRRVRTTRIVLVVSGVAGLVLVAIAGDRVLDSGSTGAESTRMLIWKASLRMALDHPLWGVGLDQFLTQYWPRYVDPAGWPERYTSHAHNLFLDVWLRLGILGVVAVVWLVVAIAQCGLGAVRERSETDAVAIGSVAALAAGVVHGMVDNGFFLADLAVLTWFAIALLEHESTVPIRLGGRLRNQIGRDAGERPLPAPVRSGASR